MGNLKTDVTMTILHKFGETKLKTTYHTKHKKRILVVDDDAMIRNLLHAALSKMDYEVTTASGGAEGFEQFSQDSFDLVITDCKMPGTDGWQLAALIKKTSAHAPIIMITGQGKDEVMDNMQGSDVDFLIYKPIKLDSLYEAIRTTFENNLPPADRGA